MGSAFSCLPRYGWCVPKHSPDVTDKNHASTPRPKKGHRRNLSAAFNMADLDNEYNVEKVNLNTATEEELMTLPGINRQTAHYITEYRQQIGAFKRIEDVALVSGVGATKVELLRSEISVANKKSSIESSLSSSHQDVSFPDNTSRSSSKSHMSSLSKSQTRINLNSSNVFQLMKVKGITQPLAENIVMYRDKKGDFKSLDDLIKVKGIKPGLLSAIRPQLKLHDYSNSSINPSHTHSRRKTSTAQNSTHSGLYPDLTNLNLSRKVDSQEDLCSIYGPLGRRSLRKQKTSVSDISRGGVIRIASWNLQQCSSEKADNPGVKEVFAMTVLENEISIIAVQELKDLEALQTLCDELNSPTIPNVRKWPGHRGVWKCVTSQPSGRMFQGMEHLGFAYDASRGIELKSHDLLDSSITCTAFARRPFLAIFQLSHYDIVLVNLHLKCPGLNDEDISRLHGEVDSMSSVIQTVHKHIESEKDVMVLGDFNMVPDGNDFSSFGELGYSNVLHKDQYTNISTRNPEGTKCYDNIWLGEHLQTLQTGTREVIRDGLTSPWIPDGWGWGGTVSDHCPVMVELRTKPNHVRRVEDVNFALKVTAGGSA